MTDKRRQLLELLAQGWSVRSACTKLGISRSSGNRWKNGWLVRQKDGTVKFVPPLEPLAARTISPRFLSEAERIQIADLASRGLGPTAIGQALGRAPSTISRELRRNLHASGQYRPFHAHSAAATRRRRSRPLKLSTDAALRAFVFARLQERWSPQQIARSLKLTHPTDPSARVATETIYQAIYRPDSGVIRKSASSPLRTGRDHRRGQSRQVRTRRRFAQPMLSVHERGFEPTDRSIAGHWEGDLIVGPHSRSAIGTLVERQTRFVRLLHLPAHNSTELLHALVRTLNELPAPLRRTVTWDQGTEMARHLEITQATGTRIYFCDSGSPWQRGSNENTNGLLRQYFPKSTDLSIHTARDLARVENELNRRPRITLGDRAPADLFAALLASENPPSLQ
ncbi:IS30 family transposase [Microbacterium trichothecenolyticum]|uniref:IS30 family transposase n=1 Tax=Microbacterium trichothecenolyticum TaxID=69370 RepID=UPI00285F9BE8|nr:IS30 family transposase [Microbacterium trichothecenolyticum]MDR7187182.1 IS30 family transposase [Microbacterium trichothecenolyticum]